LSRDWDERREHVPQRRQDLLRKLRVFERYLHQLARWGRASSAAAQRIQVGRFLIR